MKSSTSANLSLANKKEPGSTDVLMRWLDEVTCFRQNYYHIERHVGQQLNDLCLPRLNVIHYTTQCSTGRLVALQISMRTELERLLMDMEAEGGPPGDLVKLRAHTRQLRYLNQQARTQLLLTSTSAS